jgi:hypothetical protein
MRQNTPALILSFGAAALLSLPGCSGNDGGGGASGGDGVLTDSGLSAGDGPSSGDSTGNSDESTGMSLDVGGTGNTAGTADDGGFDDPCMEAAALQSNQGCEFFAVDLPNIWAGINGGPSPEVQQFAIVLANASTTSAAHVEVYWATSNTMVGSTDVAIGQAVTLSLPEASIEPRANSFDGEAFRIESDLPVTAYQFQPLDNTTPVFSNDASLLFPTHTLAEDYTAITGDGIMLSTDEGVDWAGAFVSVVATQDGTNVEIFPSVELLAGAEVVTLNRGQVATWISSGTVSGVAGAGNLSGSRIEASAPVAVFSGNDATIEPQPAVGSGCCADHLEHQMLPLVAWGHQYVMPPSPAPGNASANNRTAYRITGAYDGTSLVYNPSAPPGAPASINAYQTVRFESDAAFTVTSADTSKPFALTEFLLSNQAIAGAFGQDGDPAMIAIPAAAQFRDRYVFPVPEGYNSNFATLSRPAGTVVELDGAPILAPWSALGTLDGVSWEYIHVAVGVGSHNVQSTDGTPIGIIGIGYDQDVSYGYPGGSGFDGISEPPPPPID